MQNAHTQDLVEGPFDPDAAVEELETTRSSAFDAVVKPVVGAMEASKISVIGKGLSARMGTPAAADVVAGDTKDSDRDVHTTTT